MKKKIIFLTCTWQRVNVTKIYVDSLISEQKKIQDVFDFTNVIIDSENTNLELFENNPDFIYHNYNNSPLSNKWNYGSSLCRDIDFDYIIILGSDDIIDESLLRKYHSFMMDDYDYIGINDMYVYNTEDNRLYYWGGYTKLSNRFGETLGLGRCLSKKLVESLDYQLWINGLDKGLDSSMETKIKKLNDVKIINFQSKDYGFACDIKSNINITKFNTFRSKPVNIDLMNEELYQKLIKIDGIKMSIIISTYKNVEFIDECINSIINSYESHKCEILIGIDNCEQTLEHIQNNSYPQNVKFYYFEENYGPYIVFNTLSQISNSDVIMFFGSDDVMGENMI